MIDVFNIEGEVPNLVKLSFDDMKLYLNIPSWIEERNVYDVNTKKQVAVIKPKKYGGLSYFIYDIVDDFAKIKTVNFGYVLVKITPSLTISNIPYHESGCY